MRTTMLILLICALTQIAAFGELTKEDLEAIQKVVKEEISESEQRTASTLAGINTEIANIKTEIKVIKTDIKGVKDRLGDTHTLVIAIIASIGVIIILGSAMTYAAGKLGSAITEIRKIYASNDETKELIKQDTAANEEINRLLSEYTKRHEEQNANLADIQAKIEELLEEVTDEPSNDPIAHAPAD